MPQENSIKLSIIIPVFNEENFLDKLFIELVHYFNNKDTEVIIIDDGSTDNTKKTLIPFLKKINYIYQENQGKGRAVQNGIKQASGKWILIQDADLEYDPKDYIPMLKIAKNKKKIAIYGSRIKGRFNSNPLSLGRYPNQKIGPWLANIVLSIVCFILFKVWISDTLTAYKLYPKSFFNDTKIQTNGFETDHEITAKLIKKGYSIDETAISYTPRSYEEGKKIKMRDGIIAIVTFIKYRFYE